MILCYIQHIRVPIRASIVESTELRSNWRALVAHQGGRFNLFLAPVTMSWSMHGKLVCRRRSVLSYCAFLLSVWAISVSLSRLAVGLSTESLSNRGLNPSSVEVFKSVFLVASRRTTLCSCGALLSTQLLTMSSTPAVAVDDDEASTARDRVARSLHAVPTFCIVDPKGVPYVVVGEDAKVTGYFFTEYEEADRILRLARTSADKAIRNSNEKMANPWKDARISTVPMDVAATLATKSSSSRTHFHIAPSEVDIEDALMLTGKATLAEGKVPLFYYENFTLEDNTSPLFFSKAQLERAWKDRGSDLIVQPNVTELFAVLSQIVLKPDDLELKNLLIVPPVTSAARAKECSRRGGKESPFLLGQQILVL